MRQTRPAPVIEGFSRRCDRLLHVFEAALRNLRDRLARGRPDVIDDLSRTALDEFTIDQEFVLSHLNSPFRLSKIVLRNNYPFLSFDIRTISHKSVRLSKQKPAFRS